MRLFLFFIFLSAIQFGSLSATCQFKGEGEWVEKCCTSGANCLQADGICYTNDLNSPACQATLKCLQDHKVCNDCLSIWGLKFCSVSK